MEDRQYCPDDLHGGRPGNYVAKGNAINAPILQFLKEGLHAGGGLSSRCPLADYWYAYRRFSAARQARSALFRQAHSPAYETLLVQTWTLNRSGPASSDNASRGLCNAEIGSERGNIQNDHDQREQ